MTAARQWWGEGRQEGLQEGEQKGRQEGEQKGRQEGEQKGLLKGQALAMSFQLKLKFREQYEAYMKYLPMLNSQQLDLVAERILWKDKIEDVFEGLIS